MKLRGQRRVWPGIRPRGRARFSARFSARFWARFWAAPAAALALLLLTGCGEISPGTAAMVNDTRITNDQVDELASAQCAAADRAAKSGNSTAMAVSRVKRQSLGLLMDTELSLQYGQDEGIKPEKSLSKGLYSQIEPGIAPLPAKVRTVLSDVFRTWARGRAILVAAGSRSTGKAASLTNLDELTTAGLKERDVWLKKVKITTDPRYAPSKEGFPGGGDGSVSRPGSDFAKGASATQANPSFVAGLPSSQTCG